MFNLGLPEILVIGAAALLVFGPRRLPELGKSLGKGIRDFKKALEGGADDEETPKTLPPHGETVSRTADATAEKAPEKKNS